MRVIYLLRVVFQTGLAYSRMDLTNDLNKCTKTSGVQDFLNHYTGLSDCYFDMILKFSKASIFTLISFSSLAYSITDLSMLLPI